VFTGPLKVRWNTGLVAIAASPWSLPLMVSVPDLEAAAPLALPPHPATSSPMPAARVVAAITVLFTYFPPDDHNAAPRGAEPGREHAETAVVTPLASGRSGSPPARSLSCGWIVPARARNEPAAGRG